MIKHLNLHYAFTNPASVHDEEALTALELAGRQGAKINEVVDEVNRQTTVQIPAEVAAEVQEYINNGEFDAAIDEYADGLQEQINVLRGRVNTFTALDEGATTADAEVADIRTGVDGKVAATAGESVRRQIDLLPFPRSSVISQNVNLDTFTTPGFYSFDSCTFENLPPSMVANPHWGKVETIKSQYISSNPWYIQTLGRWDYPATVSRMIVAGSPKAWMWSDGVIRSTNDTTDRTTELQAILNRFKKLKLGPGVFYISQISMPEGATIEGSGECTEIYGTGGSVSRITVNKTATVRDLTMAGSFTEQPADGTTDWGTAEVGIYIGAATENVNIEGCWFRGFHHSGIWCDNTGTGVRSIMVNNCDFKWCRAGIWIQASEYATVTGCVFRDNNIGAYNFGGNNKFAACGFDSNNWGFVVGGTTNNGHGSAVGCSFNHNVNRGVYLNGVNYGYVFSGCQFHDNAVRVDANSQGALFTGCNFGAGAALMKYGTYPAYVMASSFYVDPLSVEGYINQNGSLIYKNCVNFVTGEEIESATV